MGNFSAFAKDANKCVTAQKPVSRDTGLNPIVVNASYLDHCRDLAYQGTVGVSVLQTSLCAPLKSTCLYQLEDGTQLPLLTKGQRCLHFRTITGAALNMAMTRVLLMVWSRPTSTADYLVPGMSAADFPLDDPTCWKLAMMGCLSCMTSLWAPHSCMTNLQVHMLAC